MMGVESIIEGWRGRSAHASMMSPMIRPLKGRATSYFFMAPAALRPSYFYCILFFFALSFAPPLFDLIERAGSACAGRHEYALEPVRYLH